MTAPGPGDRELVAALEASFDRPVVALARAPYRYATSHALEEVQVELEGGERTTLILKDLDPARLAPGAVDGKPAFLREPRREIETYRRLLAGTAIGPRCHGARSDEHGQWLLLAKVPGVELWQVGRLEVWEAVAAWLAGFHERFAVCADSIAGRNPYVLTRDRADFDRWRERGRAALAGSDDVRAGDLARRLDALPPPNALTSTRRTLLHGELYPSNVLVGEDGTPEQVWPVDWEMAATGPPAFDLAALLTGWDDPVRERMVERYRGALPRPPAAGELAHDIDVCRLHLACQWLGWTPGWQAPAEHAHDWIGEALDAIGRLEW